MSEYSKERFYWLRLKRDFFKRHDVRILESMPNGKEYLLFYLKLLVESIDHEGALRFSELIPYDEQMLSVVTNTNVDVVRSAMTVLANMGLVEVLDDKTIYMSGIESLIGSQTKSANKKALQRDRVDICPPFVHPVSTFCPPEKEKEKEIEKETIPKGIAKKENEKRFVKPTVDEVKSYCESRGNSVDPERFVDFYEAKGWMVGKNHMKDWKAAVRTWERKEDKDDFSDERYAHIL